MNKQIFLDMDGVIVDLHAAVAQRLGLVDMTVFNRGELAMTDAEIWSGTDAEWWANLPWMSDGEAIVKVCEDAVGAENLIICSKPANWPGSAEGKLRWIENHLPGYARRFVLTPDKAWCANGRTLLIDDNENNIFGFRAAGGATLLCPRPWNALSGLTAVDYIEFTIQEMLEW